MFDQHESFLQERMDPDSGLLDKLLANKTLSKIEYDDIKDHRPFYRRNARLLDYISQKQKYDSLIGALKDTRQTHLVNYLTGSGGTTISALIAHNYIDYSLMVFLLDSLFTPNVKQ